MNKVTTDLDYQRALGERLRAVRRARGLSQAAVAHQSGGAWPAAVIGSYERGDRAITVGRLAALAAFYELPPVALLPGGDGAAAVTADRVRRALREALAALEGGQA